MTGTVGDGTSRVPTVQLSLLIYISKPILKRNSVMSSHLPFWWRKTLFVELIECGTSSTRQLFGGCASFQRICRNLSSHAAEVFVSQVCFRRGVHFMHSLRMCGCLSTTACVHLHTNVSHLFHRPLRLIYLVVGVSSSKMQCARSWACLCCLGSRGTVEEIL